MDSAKGNYKTIDEYINSQSEEVKPILQELRKVIHQEVPEAVETISYKMPTFKLNGKSLIYFAAFKSHIGVYPTDTNLETELKEVAKYKTGKGTLQFPLDEPFPMNLIKEIVRFRVREINNV